MLEQLSKLANYLSDDAGLKELQGLSSTAGLGFPVVDAETLTAGEGRSALPGLNQFPN